MICRCSRRPWVWTSRSFSTEQLEYWPRSKATTSESTASSKLKLEYPVNSKWTVVFDFLNCNTTFMPTDACSVTPPHLRLSLFSLLVRWINFIFTVSWGWLRGVYRVWIRSWGHVPACSRALMGLRFAQDPSIAPRPPARLMGPSGQVTTVE